MNTTKTNNDKKKKYGKTELKVKKIRKYLRTEGRRADYGPSTPNKMALAPSLNFCSLYNLVRKIIP